MRVLRESVMPDKQEAMGGGKHISVRTAYGMHVLPLRMVTMHDMQCSSILQATQIPMSQILLSQIMRCKQLCKTALR
jgi:hypothetical protein